MTDQPDTNAMIERRKRRGEELRALVVSWQEERPYEDVLMDQTQQIAEGKFALNEDWYIMADEILGAFLSQPKMPDWGSRPESPEPQGG